MKVLLSLRANLNLIFYLISNDQPHLGRTNLISKHDYKATDELLSNLKLHWVFFFLVNVQFLLSFEVSTKIKILNFSFVDKFLDCLVLMLPKRNSLVFFLFYPPLPTLG